MYLTGEPLTGANRSLLPRPHGQPQTEAGLEHAPQHATKPSTLNSSRLPFNVILPDHAVRSVSRAEQRNHCTSRRHRHIAFPKMNVMSTSLINAKNSGILPLRKRYIGYLMQEFLRSSEDGDRRWLQTLRGVELCPTVPPARQTYKEAHGRKMLNDSENSLPSCVLFQST
jgi:hypothetical protein